MKLLKEFHGRHTKALILLVSAALLLCAVGGSMAWIVTETTQIDNVLVPAQVSCAVAETFANNKKTDVSIQNTSNIDAYIRVALVPVWKDAQGNVAPENPAAGVDYRLVLKNDGWQAGADGFYYYSNAVAPGGSTGVLIESCEPLRDKEGYAFELQILCSAVQAAPASAVNEAWGAGVEGQ